MTSYRDVVAALGPFAAWDLAEPTGTDYAPYAGPLHWTGSGTILHSQAGPSGSLGSIHLAAGARLFNAIQATWNQPSVWQFWLKEDAATSGSGRLIYYAGNGAADGYGYTIPASAPNIKLLEGGVNVYDTAIPNDTNWHLWHMGSTDGVKNTVWRDNVLLYSSSAPLAPLTPSAGIAMFGDNTGPSNNAGYIAYPAIYLHTFTQPMIAASVLAATDPATALAMVGGTGQPNTNLQTDLLNQILASVRRTYS